MKTYNDINVKIDWIWGEYLRNGLSVVDVSRRLKMIYSKSVDTSILLRCMKLLGKIDKILGCSYKTSCFERMNNGIRKMDSHKKQYFSNDDTDI